MRRARAIASDASVATSAEDFLARMSSLMGLPAGSEHALREPAAFRGFAGFQCRLQLAADPSTVSVRPEVLLPIAARELNGPEVERLLALQQALMMELGWVVGLSVEGLLQLSPIAWIDEPGAAVAALDLGQMLGLDALDELVGSLADDDEDAPLPVRSRRAGRMRRSPRSRVASAAGR